MPNHSRRHRNSRRRVKGGSCAAAHTPTGSNQFAMVGGSTVPVVVVQSGSPAVPVVVQSGEPAVAGYVPPSVGGLAPFTGGLRKKRGGTALLADIAIPALFLTANQIVGSRRSKTASKNKRRRTRFSRKVR